MRTCMSWCDQAETSELAAMVAPHEEMSTLDLATVAAAEGYASEAEQILREDVCDAFDDWEAPMKLSEPTGSIIHSHDRLTRGRPPVGPWVPVGVRTGLARGTGG